MATLWERISGNNLPEGSVADDEQKIAIHAFWGMIHEWQRGHETQANVLSEFSLTGSQLTDGQTIKQHINAAPDQVRFIRVCKDWSYCAEASSQAKYLDWTQFVTRMADEVTEQGGTPP